MRLSCSCGAAVVQLWCSRDAAELQLLWCSRDAAKVQLWCSCGATVMLHPLVPHSMQSLSFYQVKNSFARVKDWYLSHKVRYMSCSHIHVKNLDSVLKHYCKK
jgi:hypothetical protein